MKPQKHGRKAKKTQDSTALGEERKKWYVAPNAASKKVPEKMILDLASGDFQGSRAAEGDAQCT